MRELIRDRIIAIDAERALNITESYRKNLMMPPAIKRATGTYDVCSKMTCRVEDFELIVGNFGTSFLGSAVWPEEGFEWFYREFDGGELWLRGRPGRVSPRRYGDQAVHHRGGEGQALLHPRFLEGQDRHRPHGLLVSRRVRGVVRHRSLQLLPGHAHRRPSQRAPHRRVSQDHQRRGTQPSARRRKTGWTLTRAT